MQQIKSVMEWPSLETFSEKCDGDREVETNGEKAMGVRRQRTHGGWGSGEKVGMREKSEHSERKPACASKRNEKSWTYRLERLTASWGK